MFVFSYSLRSKLMSGLYIMKLCYFQSEQRFAKQRKQYPRMEAWIPKEFPLGSSRVSSKEIEDGHGVDLSGFPIKGEGRWEISEREARHGNISESYWQKSIISVNNWDKISFWIKSFEMNYISSQNLKQVSDFERMIFMNIRPDQNPKSKGQKPHYTVHPIWQFISISDPENWCAICIRGRRVETGFESSLGNIARVLRRMAWCQLVVKEDLWSLGHLSAPNESLKMIGNVEDGRKSRCSTWNLFLQSESTSTGVVPQTAIGQWSRRQQ
jgi:hypothetical protein